MIIMIILFYRLLSLWFDIKKGV